MHFNTRLLCAAAFSNAATVTLPALFAPRLFSLLGVANVEGWSGAYVSAVMLFQIAANPMWHAASHRIGLAASISAGQAFLAATLLLAAATPSPPFLLALRCAQGLSNGNLSLVRIAINKEGRPGDVPAVVTSMLAGVLFGSLAGAYLYDGGARSLPHSLPYLSAAVVQMAAGAAMCARDGGEYGGEEEDASPSSSSSSSSAAASYSYVLARHPRTYATQVASQCLMYGTDMLLSLALRAVSPSSANRHMAVSNACAMAAAVGVGTRGEEGTALLASAFLYAAFGGAVLAAGLGEGFGTTAALSLRGMGYGLSVVSTSVLVNRAVRREAYMPVAVSLFQTLTSAVATASPLGAAAAWKAATDARLPDQLLFDPPRLAFGSVGAASLLFAASLSRGWHRDALPSSMV